MQEALIKGLKVWRDADGAYPEAWFGGQRKLRVLTDAGDDLNAFYDRRSLQFFHHTFDGQRVHSSESVDVAVHEEGHALLDMLRPDFFDVPFIEVGALHESFGDCIAILAALSDKAIRESLVADSPDLSAKHFVQAMAEQLGDAIRREYGDAAVEDGALRNASNSFSWSDPTALPPGCPATVLSGEVTVLTRFHRSVLRRAAQHVSQYGQSLGRVAQPRRADAGQAVDLWHSLSARDAKSVRGSRPANGRGGRRR